MMLPLTLALFTSCRGHFDKDTYEYSISDLLSKVDFLQKVVHIKWREEEREKRKNMTFFFESLGFKVLETKGEWKHNDGSHYVEHAKDIARLMRSYEVQSVSENVLWLEDDVLFRTTDSIPLDRLVTSGIHYLHANPQSMCVRVLDREDILSSLLVDERTKNCKIFAHKDCFSFRANIMRARDAYVLGSCFKDDFPRLQSVHIERFATEVLRKMSGEEYPFACFSLDFLKHIHIGSKEFDINAKYQ